MQTGNDPVEDVVDSLVDKSVDKRVDNLVDKVEDKSVNNLDDDADAWYCMLADHLTAWHPAVDDLNKSNVKQIIKNLGQALDAGHTCILLSTEQALSLTHPLVVDEAEADIQAAPLIRAGDYLYFYRQWQQEYRLAARLIHLLQAIRPVFIQFDNTEQANLLQRQAIELAARQPFCLITGGPGTGKTYTLVRIVKALQQQNTGLRVALAAPTGKAAQRMQSVLEHAFSEQAIDVGNIQAAQTVHRLLGLGSNSRPRFDANTPLPYDLIVLDEGSMLDLALASLLFDAVAVGTRFIILGDADQLAAVDAGAVLADLQQSDALKNYQIHLTESKRFAADQGVGLLAQAVLQQHDEQVRHILAHADDHEQVTYHAIDDEQISKDKAQQQQVFNQLWQGFAAYLHALKSQVDVKELFMAFDDYRILTAMRAGVFGTQRINQEISNRLKAGLGKDSIGEWFTGRPVMMNRNDYGLQLSNGDIGLCLQNELGKWQVHFPHLAQPIAVSRLPLHDISTAFALTIHKSQGSEFKHVAICLDSHAQELLSRELFYTAITRARQQVSLWASPGTVANTIKNKMIRHTGLKRILNQTIA